MPIILGVFGFLLVFILGESVLKKHKSRKLASTEGVMFSSGESTGDERTVINLSKADEVVEDEKVVESIKEDIKIETKKKATTAALVLEESRNEIADEVALEVGVGVAEVVLDGVAGATANAVTNVSHSAWDCGGFDCVGLDCACS